MSTLHKNQSENPRNDTVSLGNPIRIRILIPSTLPNSSPGDSSTIPNNLCIIYDLDIPIAIRKGAQSYTKHPNAKYLSYQRLFKNHKAFACRISQLFVPRNI